MTVLIRRRKNVENKPEEKSKNFKGIAKELNVELLDVAFGILEKYKLTDVQSNTLLGAVAARISEVCQENIKRKASSQNITVPNKKIITL